MLTPQKPWTEQPQYALGVNDSSSLSYGLTFLHSAATEYNAVDGTIPSRSGATRSLTAQGIVHKYSGANARHDYGQRRVVPGASTTYTILAAGVFPSTGRGVLLSQGLQSGVFPQTGLMYGIDAAGSASAGRVTLFEYSSAVTAAAATATTVADDAFHVAVGIRNGAAANTKIYVDGIDKTSTTGGNGLSVNNSSQWLSVGNEANYSGTDREAEQGVALCAVWNRVLSPQEIFEVSINPWQLFKPLSVYIPTQAAGATVPTLSASTYVTGSLTSTGWRPQVTAS